MKLPKNTDLSAAGTIGWGALLWFLWTILLVVLAPVLFHLERSWEYHTTHPSVSVIEKRPWLDWTRKLTHFELKIVSEGKERRVPWPDATWWVTSNPDGTSTVSSPSGQVSVNVGK
jgi:hypothetical protein